VNLSLIALPNTPKLIKHTNPSNMKKILLGGLITIITLTLLSYTTTDNGNPYHLKQKRVVTTDDIKLVNKLVKQGYRVEFVTENMFGQETETTYTLILY
jgi:hypothetical protein